MSDVDAVTSGLNYPTIRDTRSPLGITTENLVHPSKTQAQISVLRYLPFDPVHQVSEEAERTPN